MQAIINGKTYDTNTATHLGERTFGEYGKTDEYEENLFIAECGQHFLYGFGGSESLYADPSIKLITDDEAELWKTENGVAE